MDQKWSRLSPLSVSVLVALLVITVIAPIAPGTHPTAVAQIETPTAVPMSDMQIITYTVQAGDTLGILADKFNTTLEVLVALRRRPKTTSVFGPGFPREKSEVISGQVLNGIENPDLIQVGQVLTTKSITYTVQAGDTLGILADKFNTTLEVLVALNGIENPDLIQVGQVLTTKSITYTVQAGDTLGILADKFNTTLEVLVALNGIENPDLIQVGQVLTIKSILDRSAEMRYYYEVGFVDGVTCESWPRAIAPQDLMDVLAGLPQSDGAIGAVLDFLQARAKAIKGITLIGSRGGLVLSEGVTAKGTHFLGALDPETRKAYGLSHEVLCEVEDVAFGRCAREVINGNEVLLRETRPSDAGERLVILTAPTISIPKDIRADVHLILVAGEITGDLEDPVQVTVRVHSASRKDRPHYDKPYLDDSEWRDLLSVTAERSLLAVAADSISGVEEFRAGFDVPVRRVMLSFPSYFGARNLIDQRGEKAWVDADKTLWVPLGHVIEQDAPDNGVYRIRNRPPLPTAIRQDERQGGVVAIVSGGQRAPPGVHVEDLPRIAISAQDSDAYEWDETRGEYVPIEDTVRLVEDFFWTEFASDYVDDWKALGECTYYYSLGGASCDQLVEPAMEICEATEGKPGTAWMATSTPQLDLGDHYERDSYLCLWHDRNTPQKDYLGRPLELSDLRWDTWNPPHPDDVLRYQVRLWNDWLAEQEDIYKTSTRFQPTPPQDWAGVARVEADAGGQVLAAAQSALSMGQFLTQQIRAAEVQDLESGVIRADWPAIRTRLDRLDALWVANPGRGAPETGFDWLVEDLGLATADLEKVYQRAQYLGAQPANPAIRLNAIDVLYGAMEPPRRSVSPGTYFTTLELATRWDQTGDAVSAIHQELALRDLERRFTQLEMILGGLMPQLAKSVGELQAISAKGVIETEELLENLKTIEKNLNSNLTLLKDEIETIWDCSFDENTCSKENMLRAMIPAETECRKTWINLLLSIVEVIPTIGKVASGMGKAIVAIDSVGVYLDYSTELFESHMELVKVTNDIKKITDAMETAANAAAGALKAMDKLAEWSMREDDLENRLDVEHCTGGEAAKIRAGKTAIVSLFTLLREIRTTGDLVTVVSAGYLRDIEFYGGMGQSFGTLGQDLTTAGTQFDTLRSSDPSIPRHQAARAYVEEICRAVTFAGNVRLEEAYHFAQLQQIMTGGSATSARATVPAGLGTQPYEQGFLVNAWDAGLYGDPLAGSALRDHLARRIRDRESALFNAQMCLGGGTASAQHRLIFPVKLRLDGQELADLVATGKVEATLTLDDLVGARAYLQHHGAYLDPVRGILDQGTWREVSAPVVLDIAYRAYAQPCAPSQSVTLVGCPQTPAAPYLYVEPTGNLHVPTTACAPRDERWTCASTALAQTAPRVRSCLKDLLVPEPWAREVVAAHAQSDAQLVQKALNCGTDPGVALLDTPKGLPVLGRWKIRTGNPNSAALLAAAAQVDVIFLVGVERLPETAARVYEQLDEQSSASLCPSDPR